MTGTVTYSPAYTLVPTYECFNRCSYCNFRIAPGQSPWMTLESAAKMLRGLQQQGVCEILILSGEVHPRSPRRNAWFERIYQLCELALKLSFLPHTNAGPLSFAEMERLKSVNVSMGLMLEQLTPELLKTVHQHAPSKMPQLRLQQLEWAGKLQIPFTTGLLLGIGETETDWWDTLEAIASLHQRWGHIQEVILQPHSPGSQQSFDAPAFNPHQLPEVITQAREILPSDITIQIPPNLVLDPQWLLACIEAGARDLGGISPKDEVNPDYPHLSAPKLIKILEPAGWQLVPRLPVYSQYDNWLTPQLQMAVKQWRTEFSQNLALKLL
ncbi:7,8-didemethyl-8-hydroxy-5-deazariboflavin synthase subunit CofG [Chroococcidiopsis sp. CCALA 051]|uniref:7,8-didemethyl-8-hydroxy-5-deazariboflavin synthase subunit CofG n=1 Tax=Chroococcidiopsis sp. CCALA 051 TaxID=869949 RepID=UPI000D0D16A0|nr:7,8-didemethyl-8-hydroxy-5-deazariboflavin synthase subunit CofG [Chroococcidiopsis sp. CCALA 051]PSM45603.1 7,8-didemethyl-8-hydroxy-5-deazariboflavin synthase subunit CofG [Chroococcidiopsis sp. CCALA 051]